MINLFKLFENVNTSLISYKQHFEKIRFFNVLQSSAPPMVDSPFITFLLIKFSTSVTLRFASKQRTGCLKKLLSLYLCINVGQNLPNIYHSVPECSFEQGCVIKVLFWKIRPPVRFPKSFFYQSHVIAFGLTIPKWYNTWVLKIFFVNICSKIFFPIFEKNISKNIFNTQVLYHFGIVRPNAITWL